MPRRALAALAVIALVLVGLAPAADAAATHNWTGALGTGSWQDDGNWAEGAAPHAGDVVAFPDSGSKATVNHANLNLAGIQFGVGGYSVASPTATITTAAIDDNAAPLQPDNAITAPLALPISATVASGGHTLVLSGVLSGADLVKRGPGSLELSGANTFTGPVSVENGRVEVTNPSGLGTGAGGTSANPQGTIALAHAGPFAEPFTLLGGTLRAFGGGGLLTTTVTGPLTIGAAGGSLEADNGRTLDLTGVATGTGPIFVGGPGTVRFAGTAANALTGAVTVLGATLQLAGTVGPMLSGDVVLGDLSGFTPATLQFLAAEQLDPTRTLTVNRLSVVDGGGTAQTLGSVVLNGGTLRAGTYTLTGTVTTGTGGGTLGGDYVLPGDRTLDVVDDPAVADDLVIGVGSTVTPTVAGAGALVKAGAGVLRFDGTSFAPVRVLAGSLSGTGNLAGGLEVVGGTVNPGSSPGVLNTGPLNLGSGATLRIELNGTVAGSGYDQLAVTGPVTLGNTVLSVVPGFTSATGDAFTIISNDGADPVSGTFSALAEAGTLVVGGRQYRISYTGGDGNDVVLTDLGVAPAGGGDLVTRIAGIDRVATAIEVSKDSYPTAATAGAVVVARADEFADALAGTPLAAVRNAPLLLTPRDLLDPSVRTEIQRVLPPGGTVYLLGGPLALTPTIESNLQGFGFTVNRIAGVDRYETAVHIAENLGNPNTILLATGHNFPDALAAGAAAAKVGGAVLLTADRTLPTSTGNYLSLHPGAAVSALGGPAAAARPTATPYIGVDRYETATKAATQFFPGATLVGVASGERFPDALSGGVHIARKGGPIVLAQASALPGPTATYLSGNKVTIGQAYVYGGPVALADLVLNAVRTAIT